MKGATLFSLIIPLLLFACTWPTDINDVPPEPNTTVKAQSCSTPALPSTVITAEGSTLDTWIEQSFPRPIPEPVVGLVIPINFTDAVQAIDSAQRLQLERALNESHFTYNGELGSINDYFLQISQNQLNVTHIVAEPIQLDYSSLEYNDLHPDDFSIAVNDALDQYAVANSFDGLSTTLNTSGQPVVRSLIFVSSNNQGITFGNWASSVTKTINGIGTQHYAHVGTGLNSDTTQVRLSAISHEIGHTLFQWPNLYHPCWKWSNGRCINGIKSVGAHSLMANGTAPDGVNPLPPNPYFRSLAWGSTKDIIAGITQAYFVAFNDLHHFKITNPNNDKEFLIIAANDNTQNDFYGGLPSHGLMVWHVGEKNWGEGASVSDPDKHPDYHIYVEQADGLKQIENIEYTGQIHFISRVNGNTGDSQDSFTFSDTTADNDVIFPTHDNGMWWDGTPYGFFIYNYEVLPGLGVVFHISSTLNFDVTCLQEND